MTTEQEPTDPQVPRPPLTTTTSIKPAMTVLIAAVVMLVVFISINAIFDRGTSPTPTTVLVIGGLKIDTTSHLMDGCRLDYAPPSDIATGLLVPVDSSGAGPVNLRSQGPGAFDCSRQLRTAHPQAELLGFYLHQLEAQGWRVFSRGPAMHGGGEQILLQKAGSDTFYWIEGITVASADSTSTTWTLRLYQDNSLT